MNKKCEGNENKVVFGDFNSTMDKIDRVGSNKKKLYRWRSNYALLKLIVDNECGLWGRENPEYSEFTCYNRSSGTKSRIDRVYIDIKID